MSLETIIYKRPFSFNTSNDKHTDKIIYRKMGNAFYIRLIIGVIGVVLGGFMYTLRDGEVAGVMFVISSLIMLIKAFTSEKDLFIEFNREKGIVKYRHKGENITGKFKDLEAVIDSSNVGSGSATLSEELRVRLKGQSKYITLDMSSDPIKTWSFYVWYMDKNRPLPPGGIFDKYRESDYKRRKSLGFPKPVYSSYVPTGENSFKKQEERKRIGGW